MKVAIVPKKYKCGSDRGIGEFIHPEALKILNEIIDWDASEFPQDPNSPTKVVEKDITDLKNAAGEESLEGVIAQLIQGMIDCGEDGEETEIMGLGKVVHRGGRCYIQTEEHEQDRKYLGDIPELKPGNVILWENQLIAIDRPDRLILTMSESGPLALDRIWKEEIYPEYILKKGPENTDDLDIELQEISRITKPELEDDLFLESWDELWNDSDTGIWRKFKKIMKEKLGDDYTKPLLLDLEIFFNPTQLYINLGTAPISIKYLPDSIISSKDMSSTFLNHIVHKLWNWVKEEKPIHDL